MNSCSGSSFSGSNSMGSAQGSGNICILRKTNNCERLQSSHCRKNIPSCVARKFSRTCFFTTMFICLSQVPVSLMISYKLGLMQLSSDHVNGTVRHREKWKESRQRHHISTGFFVSLRTVSCVVHNCPIDWPLEGNRAACCHRSTVCHITMLMLKTKCKNMQQTCHRETHVQSKG